MACTTARGEVISQGPNQIRGRYYNDFPEEETATLCLVRQGFSRALPRLFGLPSGTCTKTACIANGDDYCEYTHEFYTSPRTSFPLLAGLVGVCVSLGLAQLSVGSIGIYVLLPISLTLAQVAFDDYSVLLFKKEEEEFSFL